MRKLLLALTLMASLRAGATVYYVDGSQTDNLGAGTTWGTAKRDLQNAINLASANGDEVWVKSGTYYPTQDPNGVTQTGTAARDHSFYIKAFDIKCYGGFTGVETASSQRNPVVNPTVLSGDINVGGVSTADCYHVMVIIGRTNACTVDGFTLRDGQANGGGGFSVTSPAVGLNRGYAGGLLNVGNPTINNCNFISNRAVFGAAIFNGNSNNPIVTSCNFITNTATNQGGAVYCGTSNASISACVFSGNTAVDGGAIATDGQNPTIANSIFTGNTASNFGGAICCTYSTAPPIKNCTFYNNRTTGSGLGGALYYDASGGGTVTNCILYGNTTAVTTDVNREEIYKSGTSIALSVSYSIIRDYRSTATNNYTSGTAITSAYPSFVSTTNLIGNDGIWRTTDDGLFLKSCSPAINAGTSSTSLPTDITNNNRFGSYDIGAYEYQGAPTAPVLSSSTTTSTSAQSSTVTYGECSAVVASLQSSGSNPVTGDVTAKVYVQSTATTFNGQPYVRRYYDILPAVTPNTATATVTLYFLQSDFDDYNLIRGTRPSLPTSTTNSANTVNLRVTQQHGTSATGVPGTYTGWAGTGPANVLITPTTVSYNTVASRWEVTFPVTGFSGFFAHTTETNFPLPVELLSFTATRTPQQGNRMDWLVGNEEDGIRYEVTRSTSGTDFEAMGTVVSKGSKGQYTFYDEQSLNGTTYYRLKITGINGEIRYSNVAIVHNTDSRGAVSVAPVPADRSIHIHTMNTSLQGTEAVIMDLQGRVVYRLVLDKETTVDCSSWPAGMYCLKLTNGEVIKLVKQ